MLDKIFKDKGKFSGTSQNFNFKITIFYDKYRRVRLLLNSFIYSISIILFGQAWIYQNYTNYENISTFDQLYINIQLFFEELKQ